MVLKWKIYEVRLLLIATVILSLILGSGCSPVSAKRSNQLVEDCTFIEVQPGMSCQALFEIHKLNKIYSDECNKKNRQLRKHQ